MDLFLGQKTSSGAYGFSDDSNDIHFDEHGLLKTVADEAKLAQNIFKILKTEVGSSALLPSYGTNINSMLTKSDQEIGAFIHSSVLGALATLKSIYSTSGNRKEKIGQIQNFALMFSNFDPTSYYLYFEAITDEGLPYSIMTSV